ncbi:MBL fold metallo-hydrolase [Sphingosinicellaceae bacterium]|nr:MBL fold metallo-hydrolase [Sphingosinicellaceae bacterium]
MRIIFAVATVVATLGLIAAGGCSAAGPHRDRFYTGPVSEHFDGRKFFNPDGEQGTGGQEKQSNLGLLERAFGKGQHSSWPKSVPVTPSVPPARVAGTAMRVTWIGHATALIQTNGLNILLDPVWSERDSPVAFAGPRRVREPGVRFADLPKIDLVLLSHNHYDHLDLAVMGKLWRRDHPLIVTGLGNDVLLADHGIKAVARDWGGTVAVAPGVIVTLHRAHHWSAHWVDDHDLTLWTAFRVTLPGGDLYYAGDTGPGDMKWGLEARTERPVRLAVLPIGAIKLEGAPSGNHIGPAEAVTAFGQLGAAYALGVHWGTFELTSEAIDEPPQLLAKVLAEKHIEAGRFRVLEAGGAWEIPAIAGPEGIASR